MAPGGAMKNTGGWPGDARTAPPGRFRSTLPFGELKLKEPVFAFVWVNGPGPARAAKTTG